jgi:hypothetical protein
MADDDYEDAARRILDANVPDNAVSRADVVDALRTAGDARVAGGAVDMVLDYALTEEDVYASIEASGELPSDSELGAFVAGTDGVGSEGRRRAVEQAVSDEVVTREMVENSVRASSPTYRDEVESAVEGATGRRKMLGASQDEVVDEFAREIGTPRRSDVEGMASSIVRDADSVKVRDVVEGSEANAPVSIVRDEGGDVVAALGRQDAAEAVAQDTGGRAISPSELKTELGVRTTGGSTADVTLGGAKVGEVEVR